MMSFDSIKSFQKSYFPGKLKLKIGNIYVYLGRNGGKFHWVAIKIGGESYRRRPIQANGLRKKFL